MKSLTKGISSFDVLWNNFTKFLFYEEIQDFQVDVCVLNDKDSTDYASIDLLKNIYRWRLSALLWQEIISEYHRDTV